MDIKVYFDASYISETNTAGISVIIKCEKNKLILNSSKKITCSSSTEAEFRALNKAINYINHKQLQGIIPMNNRIVILGDCNSVIEISKRFWRMKGIEPSLMKNYLIQISTLRKNNKVHFIWIPRRYNIKAHKKSKEPLIVYSKKIESGL